MKWLTLPARREQKSDGMTLDQLLERLAAQMNTAAGEQLTPETALKSPTVFSIVNLVRRTMGQLPIDVIRRSGNRREPDPNHPVARLLNNRPNRWQTPYQFKALIGTRLMLQGNYYAQKLMAGDKVVELNPLAVPSVTPEQLDNGAISYKVNLLSGQPVVLPQAKMLHIRDMSCDGIVGASPVEKVRESIALEIAAEKFGAAFFGSGAIPSGILSHPAYFKDEAARLEFKRSWRELFGAKGREKRGTAVLEGGLTFTSTQINNEQSQFLETRTKQREIIAGAWGIPPHMIGALERATFNNIEHLSLEYVIYFLTPLLTNIEQQFAADLLTEADRNLYQIKFNVAALLRGDQRTRAETLAIKRQNGIINANEWREIEDMNPIEGPEGDVYLAQTNMGVPGATPEPAAPAEPAVSFGKPAPGKAA